MPLPSNSMSISVSKILTKRVITSPFHAWKYENAS